jgi:hypothetical protein
VMLGRKRVVEPNVPLFPGSERFAKKEAARRSGSSGRR